MRARLPAPSDFPSILTLFISFGLSILLNHTPGGFSTNHTDHFYCFSIGRLSDHGHHSFVDFCFTVRQIRDNSTSLTIRWLCSSLLVPIRLWWGWFQVREALLGLPSLGPCVKRFPRRTLQ